MDEYQIPRGYASQNSVSPRPKGGKTVTDLEGDLVGRRSTGYPDAPSVSPNTRTGSMPSTDVPRGYVHNEASAQPTVRNTSAGKIRKVNP